MTNDFAELKVGTTQAAGTVEVHIRNSAEADGPFLCIWPVTELQTLINELGKWGVVDNEGTMRSHGSIVGQFIFDNTNAYFEVVVGDD